ncbi:hypothetical protein KIN20_036213 [Parelaphostrongylus tenuis]|uniref:Uncharacterized protein n=1 Tax=Parelaphostrongylus tenuis TaxID=148309 RepID=A0AAD5RC99_PARTN|nr:hypothetical protein KIN20_036213 [Parelaphostrongylus tenuis]
MAMVEVRSNDVVKTLNVRDIERDKAILELPALTDGKYMRIGLSKIVKVVEGDGGKCTPFVVADVTKALFTLTSRVYSRKSHR